MKYSPEMSKVEIPAVRNLLLSDAAGYVRQVEEDYRQKLEQVCDFALEREKKLILITGPSASGKTTTAKRLADFLVARGKKVNRISLDNFYHPTEQLPLWEDGYQNYESVDGLDIPCFERVMHQLLTKQKAEFPIFDFTVGRRAAKTYSLCFDESTYLIIEGIHALNPMLYNTLQDYPAIKIYISVHSSFLQENHQPLLTARDLRLCRRLLRDYHYRGTAGMETLEMWRYVIKGEDLYIRPFRQHADIHIDSTHPYEPFLYYDGVNAMLDEISPESPHYETATHLLQANKSFFDISYDLIPAASLIQEFIKPGHLTRQKIQVNP